MNPQPRQEKQDSASWITQLPPKILGLRGRLLSSLLSTRWFVSRWVGELERLGSDYGGWVVPADALAPGAICYCGGVGEDATFDLALIEGYGCVVYAFDPTPRSISYAEQIASQNREFHFMPFGLWSEEAELRFYAPRDETHVSHSVLNLQRTNEYFTASCKSVKQVMEELNHDRIDLLKLDVEGAEYEILNSILQDRITPMILCIEFDQPVPFHRTLRAIRALKSAGYSLVSVEGWNCTFINRATRASKGSISSSPSPGI